jgi:hypothetical protein
MKAKLPKIIRLTAIVVCALLIILIIAVAALVFTGHSWPPNVKVISNMTSPESQWVAIIENEDYISMFTPPFYAVVLKPQTGWFQGLREKKIFEISQESTTQPPAVRWRDANNLSIETNGLKRDIAIQVQKFGNVEIIYRIK